MVGLVVGNAFILSSCVLFSTTIVLLLSAGTTVRFLECLLFLFGAKPPVSQGLYIHKVLRLHTTPLEK
jgi:hypothetical protein